MRNCKFYQRSFVSNSFQIRAARSGCEMIYFGSDSGSTILVIATKVLVQSKILFMLKESLGPKSNTLFKLFQFHSVRCDLHWLLSSERGCLCVWKDSSCGSPLSLRKRDPPIIQVEILTVSGSLGSLWPGGSCVGWIIVTLVQEGLKECLLHVWLSVSFLHYLWQISKDLLQRVGIKASGLEPTADNWTVALSKSLLGGGALHSHSSFQVELSRRSTLR